MKKAPLRLRRRESLKTGIRRIARAQIDAACRILQADGEPHKAVHEARKALKKLRAILRLVAREFGRKAVRLEKNDFRAAARLLAPLRDADVRVQTLDTLVQNGGLEPRDFAAVRAGLQSEADRLAREAGAPKRRAAGILRKVRNRVQGWPLGDLEPKHLTKQILRTYRQGSKALAAYQIENTPETFHAWRKRVKELWYHLRILEDLLPESAAERIALCDEIGEISGKAHDLFMLRETLLGLKAGAETALLIGEVEVRMEELQRATLERGIRLHAEKPGVFAQRQC